MFKKLVISALSAVAVISPAFAGDDVTITASADLTSHYVFRGTTLAESAFQPGVEVAVGNAYGGVWHSASLEDADIFGDETDYYLGYGFGVAEGITGDVGVTRYDYAGGGGDTTEFYAGLAFDVPLEPSVYLYYDVDLEATTLEGSAGYSWDIAENASFDVGGTLGLVDADAGEYEYASLSGGVSTGLTDEIGAYASLAYVYSSEDTLVDFDDNVADDNAFVFMVGLTFE
jgi:uncharacterized protein (TIGR02001 family)